MTGEDCAWARRWKECARRERARAHSLEAARVEHARRQRETLLQLAVGEKFYEEKAERYRAALEAIAKGVSANAWSQHVARFALGGVYGN